MYFGRQVWVVKERYGSTPLGIFLFAVGVATDQQS